jgi:Pvc16 N-terminal domain/IPT/TIG domain
MSDYLAVGGVSAVLRWLLTTALTGNGPSSILGPTPGITATAPDLIPTGPNEQPQLNLFMYYVSLNPDLRNLDLPSADSQGNRLSNPPLALNLHYLVSAYGSTQFGPEILLAWAMKVFHDTPIVPSQTIQQAFTALLSQQQASAEATLIAGSTLAEQFEQIKITPETLTTEEIYRLWTAFQAAYRPSTALQVSVVVIQDTLPVTSNLPVQTRTVTALPSQAPVISNLSPLMVATGQVLTIMGSNFMGDTPADTVVSFDGGTAQPPDTVQGNLLRITVPATLQAGTRTVQVQRMIAFSDSTAPHQGFSSSPAPFQLIPTIQDPSPVQATLGSPLTITLSPEVGSTQKATLYIGDTAIAIGERPVTGPASSATITFPIPDDLPTGTFPIQAGIDGARSQLVPGAGGQFTPRVQVTS